mmetsp:Transcript_56784/g.128705  ORF Transcript_56784/g.128705 Transcript_56784/m.128705 type:complete len:94 (+) Transcript_56784:112-393(+)
MLGDKRRNLRSDPTSPRVSQGGAAQKFMTAKYDFKMMRRLTTIENKFLGALCGFYGVEDEEELPASVQEISFGEMFEAKLSADQMRQIMVRRT